MQKHWGVMQRNNRSQSSVGAQPANACAHDQGQILLAAAPRAQADTRRPTRLINKRSSQSVRTARAPKQRLTALHLQCAADMIGELGQAGR